MVLGRSLGLAATFILALGAAGCGDDDESLIDRVRAGDVAVFAWGEAVSRTCGAREAAATGGRTALRTSVGRDERTCWVGVRGRPLARAADVRSVDEQDDGSVTVSFTDAAVGRLRAVDHLGLAAGQDLLAVGDLVDGSLRIPRPR